MATHFEKHHVLFNDGFKDRPSWVFAAVPYFKAQRAFVLDFVNVHLVYLGQAAQHPLYRSFSKGVPFLGATTT